MAAPAAVFAEEAAVVAPGFAADAVAGGDVPGAAIGGDAAAAAGLAMHAAAGGGEPGAAVGGDVPAMLPYTDADDIKAGVKCCGCDSKFFSWHRLMEHHRSQHKVSYKAAAGSYLHEKAREEGRCKDRESYAKK